MKIVTEKIDKVIIFEFEGQELKMTREQILKLFAMGNGGIDEARYFCCSGQFFKKGDAYENKDGSRNQYSAQ